MEHETTEQSIIRLQQQLSNLRELRGRYPDHALHIEFRIAGVRKQIDELTEPMRQAEDARRERRQQHADIPPIRRPPSLAAALAGWLVLFMLFGGLGALMAYRG